MVVSLFENCFNRLVFCMVFYLIFNRDLGCNSTDYNTIVVSGKSILLIGFPFYFQIDLFEIVDKC